MPAGSNNPFGIKARKGEPYVLAGTWEVDRQTGRRYRSMERFRKFASLDEAFEAHARLLLGPRYAHARAAKSPDGFADALTGVYATDPQYGRKLKQTIHGRHLDQYDRVPVQVDIRVNQHGKVVSATATGGKGTKPAISHAYPQH